MPGYGGDADIGLWAKPQGVFSLWVWRMFQVYNLPAVHLLKPQGLNLECMLERPSGGLNSGRIIADMQSQVKGLIGVA